jgi:hypothetical protein
VNSAKADFHFDRDPLAKASDNAEAIGDYLFNGITIFHVSNLKLVPGLIRIVLNRSGNPPNPGSILAATQELRAGSF